MSQPITVNYTRPGSLVPPGRTVLYTATGSGQLTVYIGNDGSPNVTLYIEMDNAISDPIPGNVGTGQAIQLTFNSYLTIYADNAGYTADTAPTITVTGTVTPPAPTAPTQAAPATIDLSGMLSFMMNMMMLMMFVQIFSAMSRAIAQR